jgi:hypothetical protein
MSRKHFEAIAHALRVTRPAPEDYAATRDDGIRYEAARLAWVATRKAITRELSAFNPNFNRDRFELATER